MKRCLQFVTELIPNRALIALASVAFAGMAALPVLAVKSDSGVVHQAGVGIERAGEPAQAPSVQQTQAAKMGEADGIQVNWHARLGTPFSIRGADLGKRGSYSGGKGLGIKGGTAYASDAIAVLDNLSLFFNMRDAEKEFSVDSVAEDRLGYHHVRLSQTFNGLRVVGGNLIVHFNKNNTAYEVNGEYVRDIDLNVVPAITPDAAVLIAQKDLAAEGNPPGLLQVQPELVVLARGAMPQLAFELVLTGKDAAGGPSRWRYWVDGVNGRVLFRYNDIKKISAPTTNGTNTTFIGSVLVGEGGASTNGIGWYENTGYYYLFSKVRNWYVYNVASAGYSDAGTYAYRSTNDWGTSDRAEMSLAANFNVIQKYFSQVHGLNSFNGAGAFAVANVHEGTSYVNAYWDGYQFYFGDGDGVEANCLAVLDVAAHEFTHAVTQYSADLIYSYESGALNESFSDVLGSCVEFFAQADDRASYPSRHAGQADWLCGEDCWLSSTALRDLRNPANTATVGAGNQQPTRYLGTYWYTGSSDNGGVHQNSGVQNFFYYLLCEGGSGTNDGISYNVTGIGIANAEQVAYRALTVYCSAYTEYREARTAWLSAASDLNPAWVSSVSAAWDAVGVQAVSVAPEGGAAFSGGEGGPFSPASYTYTIVNSGSASVNWGASHNRSWLDVSPASGTIPAAGSQVVTVTLGSEAGSLSAGDYADTLLFTNSNSGSSETRPVSLRILPPKIYEFNMDTNPGWATQGQWEYGTPLGFGGDPSSGSTGTKVYGYNLSGAYSNNMPVYALTTAAIDCSRYENLALSFQRWLGVESATFDHATVQMSTNGVSWTNVWDHTGSSFQDTAWTNCVYSLPCAAGQKTVYIRWLMGPTDSSVTYSGWNIDDVCIHGTARDDMLVLPYGGLASIGYQGGPFSPTSQLYSVVNNGTGSFNWTASTTSAWVTVSSPGGSLAPGATATVSVALGPLANSRAPGVYEGTVVFSNRVSGFRTSRTVALSVLAIPGEISVSDSIAPNSDTNMPFGKIIVGLSRTETITVSNTDPDYDLVISDVRSTASYQEDFDDGLAQGWEPDNASYWSVAGGEYVAQGATDAFMVSSYSGHTWRDVACQASVRSTGDTGYTSALFFRATDDFVMDSFGNAYGVGISDGYFWVGKWIDGSMTWLTDGWVESPYLYENAETNWVAASAQANVITIYFNGYKAWEGTDDSIADAGRIALGGYSVGATAHRFDNVAVGSSVAGVVADETVTANRSTVATGKSTDIRRAPGCFTERTMASLPLTASAGIQVIGTFEISGLPSLPASVQPGSSLTFSVTFVPLTTELHEGQVVIESNDRDEPEVTVALSGEGIPDYLAVSPAAGLSGSGHPGGPFTPSSQVYVVSNNSAVGISWLAANYPGWVTVSPSSGTLAAGAKRNVTVYFNSAAITLPEGLYSGGLVFSNVTTTVSQVRSLALEVFTTPVVRVAPASLTFTNLMGQALQKQLQIGNAAWADANLSFSLGASEVSRTLMPLTLQVPARDFTKLSEDAKYRPGELLVRFADASALGVDRAQALANAGGGSVTRLFKLVPGLTVVKLPEGMVLTDALVRFNQTAGILYAQPNYLHHALRTPNDPLFTSLWGMNNTGQTGGTADADINAPEAWECGVGGPAVTVAVIDTGVDYAHEDLAANMWRNPGEIPGNGIDDDGNGYVDDVYGYDFCNGDADPMDDHDHGTHCAGTIGGVGDNGVGVAGVCWNVKIMAMKFLDSSGSGYTADAISCIEYAVQKGARVLSNSWGGGAYEQALKDMIDAAGAANVLFVAAAGNDYGNNNDSSPAYPASYESDNVISVMSADAAGAMSYFSNYGPLSVDLAAPGSSILSCMRGGGYQYMSGTSMATPHVAGACALLLSLNSAATYQQVKSALMETTDASLPGLCVSGGMIKLSGAVTYTPAWLRVNPATGAGVVPGAWSNITVTASAGTLRAGTYDGLITVRCNDRDMPVTNVPVTMVVLQDNLAIHPDTAFESFGYTGGPFAPGNALYAVTNEGAASSSWRAVASQPWITVSPESGVLGVGQVAAVTVSLNAQAGLLSPGVFSGVVVFSNLTTTAVQYRTVKLTVLERVLDHFEWSWIAPTQRVDEAFNVTITAKDGAGSTFPFFVGSVALSGFSSGIDAGGIKISEVFTGTPDAIEFVNVSDAPVNISGWKVYVYDNISMLTPLPPYTFPAGSIIPTGGVFRLTESGTAPGAYPLYYTGLNFDWVSGASYCGALVCDASNGVRDFMAASYLDPSLITNPVTVVPAYWQGSPVAGVISDAYSYQRVGNSDNDTLTDWAPAAVNIGTWNDGLGWPFVGVLPVAITPLSATGFVGGVWSGQVTVRGPATNMFLRADDGAGLIVDSNPFTAIIRVIELPEAVDNETQAWTTGGTASWVGQAAVSHDGVDAARSGTVGNRQSSWLSTEAVGPGDASFWWRVSSEADWDWLEFYVDDVLVDRLTGESGWVQKVQTLPSGAHTLKWRYVKDAADIDPVGQDCGWVDQFVAPSQSVLPLDWLLLYGLPTDGSADYADTDGDGMNNWQEWFSGTVPTNRLSLLRVESVTRESGSGYRVRWQSVAGKYYWLGSCDAMTNPPVFTPFVSNVLGEAGNTEVLDARPVNGKRFYRVGVQEE